MITPSFTTIVLISALFFGEPTSSKLITPETDAYIKTLFERWNATGLSLAVVRKDPSAPNGWYHEFGSYGTANAKGQPVTPDTVFAIASNSKLFLSFSVGLLVDNSTLREERGEELKWSTKIKDIYGDLWEMWDEDMTRKVSLQDMLSHRTGLPGHGFSRAVRRGGVREMISTLRYLRPSAEFRQTYQYNNLMYDSLSYLPTLFLNQTFESYIDQHIFTPLNMSSSTYSVAEAENRGTLADGFQYHMRDLARGINGTKRAMVPFFDRPGEEAIRAGAGGVLASARDLAMWASMLLNDGKHPHTGKQIIPSHVVEHAATGVTIAAGEALYPELSPKVYGAGHWRYSYRGRELIEHGGIDPGFRSQITRFPNDNLAIVSMSNDDNGVGLMESAKWRIIDDILFKGQEPIDWNGRYEQAQTNYIRAFQLLTPRPTLPKPPSSSVEFLAQRTYDHSTYGSLQPCVVPSSLPSRALQQRAECSTLLNSLPVRRILQATDLTIPTLIIPWKRVFVTHLRLQHFDANLFNASVIWSNADVRREEGLVTPLSAAEGINSRVVAQSEQDQAAMYRSGGTSNGHLSVGEDGGDLLTGLDRHFTVEWAVQDGEEEGLAFKGNFWGMEGSDAKAPTGEGKEGAEVWFARR